MTFDDYQTAVLRTAAVHKEMKDRLAVCGLGVAGEAGEVADEIKKVLFQGHGLDKDKLANEAGDALWYLAFLASTIGVSFEEIAERNIRKLKARYPDGFDPELSKSRKETK